MFKQKIRQYCTEAVLPLLSVVLLCLYPCAFLYARNVSEAPFGSMFPFFSVFLLNAVLFFAVFSLLLRAPSRAGFLTDLAMLAVINFTLMLTGLQTLIPELTALVLEVILGAVLLGLLILLMHKKPDMKIPCLLIALAFGTLTVFQLSWAGISMLLHHSANPEAVVQESYEPVSFQTADRPNVYYLLFDGYGGAENLQHYYGYDNEPFLTALEDRGFTVSRDSHNTESTLTVTIIPDLMNLDYVVRKEMTTAERNELLHMPNLFRTFAENGYQLNLINHLSYFGTEGCNALTGRQSQRTISDYLLRNSLYYQHEDLKKMLNRAIRANYVENYTAPLLETMKIEENCWQYTGDGPTFTLAYLQSPHAPTILDRDGKLVDNYQNVGWAWDQPQYYLGQLEFISDFILRTVDNIQAHDPDALIIVQSDHGCRQAIHYYELGIWDTYDAKTENLYMQNILNCVYYKGESFPIAGQTGINTNRIILNQVFGTDYELLEPKVWKKGRFENKQD